jgi:hypothetical protein
MLFFVFIINVAILSSIIYYLKRLETIGCKCALNFKHHYIFYFTCFMLLFSVLNYGLIGVPAYRLFRLYIYVPYVIAAIINIIYTIQYVNEMKRLNCDCSKSFYRELMYILAILQACVWILLLLSFVAILVLYPQSLNILFRDKKFWKQYLKKSRQNNAL